MKPAYILLAVAMTVALTGCGMRRALGLERTVPDEFAVVTKAPLVLPPEYNLLPPRPGEPRPQELDAAAMAQQALVGQVPATDQSPGEQTLAAQAGGLSADPAVRAAIERESAGIVYKDRAFADRILFWNGSDSVGISSDPLDPVAEAERLSRMDSINEATGGGEVRIERPRGGGLRLPGL